MTGARSPALGRRRLGNLLLGEHPQAEDQGAEQVATWLGALQAQDLGSGLWSLGARLPGSTISDMHAAVAAGTVLRTWPMRGTIHFIPSRDARWMLATTGELAFRGVHARWEYLGIDEATVHRGAEVLRQALTGGHRLTRKQANEVLRDAGLNSDGQRGYHMVWYASQVGVTCLGPNEGKDQTVVLLDEWAPDQVTRDHDDALRELALRFVRSHGPVTSADFARWTGLGVRAARAAIRANDDAVTEVELDGVPYWTAAEELEPVSGVVVLPGFDEFMLGYKDRSAMLADEHKQQIVPGNNGVFRATVVADGEVVATWKRTARAAADVIAVTEFVPLSARNRKRVTAAFAPYSHYLDRPLDIRFE